MLPLVTLPTIQAPRETSLRNDTEILQARMQKPQRHRLLHGYPLAAAMRPRGEDEPLEINYRASQRGLLIGVLPHPFCNPAIAGCGFCTFPHQRYDRERATEVIDHVRQEIVDRVSMQPALERRKVTGLYFGGGTANLAPAEPFRRLCRQLAATFDLTGAEVTLEGVPAYFIHRKPLLVDIMKEELPARHFRLSMGIQTFDPARLLQMGRQAFGTRETFARVVEMAHARGFTISGDLLFNLPGQALDEMRQDLDAALAIGLDHLGLYHLVLFRGLGTAWSHDPALLAGVPENAQAAENWLALREQLLGSGFEQTTLTNFERTTFRASARRFVYEEYSFHPDRYDMIGFGPGGISFAASPTFRTGLKTLNPDAASDYVAAVKDRLFVSDRYFAYGPTDLRIFYLTRRLAGLWIDRSHYAQLFQSDPLNDFPGAFSALTNEGLLTVTPRAICPTPRGMFYADSIAALLAWRQIEAHRGGHSARSHWGKQDEEEARDNRLNENSYGHM